MCKRILNSNFNSNCFIPINFVAGTCQEYSSTFASCELLNLCTVKISHCSFVIEHSFIGLWHALLRLHAQDFMNGTYPCIKAGSQSTGKNIFFLKYYAQCVCYLVDFLSILCYNNYRKCILFGPDKVPEKILRCHRFLCIKTSFLHMTQVFIMDLSIVTFCGF